MSASRFWGQRSPSLKTTFEGKWNQDVGRQFFQEHDLKEGTTRSLFVDFAGVFAFTGGIGAQSGPRARNTSRLAVATEGTAIFESR
jgi:hypothetical protein